MFHADARVDSRRYSMKEKEETAPRIERKDGENGASRDVRIVMWRLKQFSQVKIDPSR